MKLEVQFSKTQIAELKKAMRRCKTNTDQVEEFARTMLLQDLRAIREWDHDCRFGAGKNDYSNSR